MLERDVEHMLEHGAESWRSLSGKRVFVTGGTGFFGKWLVGGLKAAGVETVVLTRVPRGGGGFAFGDVRTFEFPKGRFDAVIHAAAPIVEPVEQASIIVEGTRRVAQFAEQAGADMLYVSSGAAALNTEYGRAKKEAEGLCPMAKIARCFSFVGPYMAMDGHFAMGNFLRDALHGKEIRVVGNPESVRSYMHMADAVVWLVRILTEGKPGRPYNVGSSEAVSIGELAQRVSSACDTHPRVRFSTRYMEPTNRYVPSIYRPGKELGLEVRIGLDDAIRRTLEWCKRGDTRT